MATRLLHIIQFDETQEEMHSYIYNMENISLVESAYGIANPDDDDDEPEATDPVVESPAVQIDAETRKFSITLKGESAAIEYDLSNPTSFRVIEIDFNNKGKEIFSTQSLQAIEQHILGNPGK